jgi:hypothetical protein
MIDEELYEKVDAARARELSAKIKAEPKTPATLR